MSDWTPLDNVESDGCLALVLTWVMTLLAGVAIGYWVIR